ncbi:MAG: ferrochelatase [Actinomycetota bacterium]
MTIDAVLLLSFGGPEGPDDVLPFLRNVTRGRNVPDERLAEVAEQYERFGGRSPINDHCRELRAAVEAELAAHGPQLPVYWGNRNWHPFVSDTVARMADDGIGHAAVFVTSAFGTYSGCRQYQEDLERARDEVGERAPTLTKLRLFYNHPGFVEPQGARLRAALDGAGIGDGPVRLVFTAHSIPTSMAAGCDYQAQLAEAADLVRAAAGLPDSTPHDVVFQSRSGPPQVPWLEPDVNDHLASVAADPGGSDVPVAVVPLGFVSDHMEVLFDLDTQARDTADRLGLSMIRVPTVGTDPRFVTMVRELVAEQTDAAPKLHLGSAGPWPDRCPEGHCPPPRRPATRPTGD